MLESERSFMLAAFIDGELVGNCGVNEIADRLKMRHRASLGISIKKKAWGLGLGTVLISRALEQAKENGFTQVELGVFADNERAIYLYRKLGFTKMGLHPKGVLPQRRHVPRRSTDGEVSVGTSFVGADDSVRPQKKPILRKTMANT